MLVKVSILLLALAVGIYCCVKVWRHRSDPQRLDPIAPGAVPGPADAGVDLGAGPST